MVKLFLIGVGCIGASSIGKEISQRLGCNYYDLCLEIEAAEGKTMPRLQREFFSSRCVREHCRPILESLIDQHGDEDYVMALNPSSLMDFSWKALKTEENRIVVALEDRPENILRRIRFYDDDQRPLKIKLTGSKKAQLLKEIRASATYFRRSYKRADCQVDIDGRDIKAAADLILETLVGAGLMDCYVAVSEETSNDTKNQ